MLRGDLVYLTTLNRTNMETARRWINDPDVNTWMLSGHIPVSATSEAAFYDSVERRAAERSAFLFEIHANDDGRYLGNCGLEDIDLIHRHAEVGIVIGEVVEQNKGFGRDAIRVLLRFGFETLGLHSIEIYHMVGNQRGAHLYGSIGFKEAGIRRQHVFLNGEWVDEAMLDMLADEWRELRG